MTYEDEREAMRMIAAGQGWKAVADRFCGEQLAKPLRERAIELEAAGVDRDAIAQCVQKSVSWVNRTVDAEQYRKHLERNAAWKRKHREQQTQAKREWRSNVKQRELDLIERLVVAVETLPERLEHALHGLLDDVVELSDNAEQERQQHANRLIGFLRSSIEGRK